ncbi:MAG TPA: HD domain-containing protein [Phycisphaerae bacterium]|nr:HD domain-containing protein [Phycisphaerae bacterium]HOJ76279.1 HD domain-containing protein [Phycisphaerae bacterium]HOM53663.1 HD domain-containing protein [Phycisphaerae bacterium]HON67547.1 HD domain-containing protein [Phycisphaerae bacterium]HOQ87680.1 HD domain-containing protein [Phycisphaerae bacterium]
MMQDLWAKAQADLCLGTSSGPLDKLVWEHSTRVAKTAASIAGLPELADRAIDRRALTAAALYHDAGWVLQYRAGEAIPRDLLLRPTSEVQRELAAAWITERLAGILPARSIELASNAIRYCNDRQTNLTEAQILAEAESLEEIGPQTIVLMVRRQLADGRTLTDMLQLWQRQEEYHYWQARIKDSFRFEPVRRLATQRWQALRRFMTDLAVCTNLEDLAALASPATLDVTDLLVPRARASA